MPVLDNRAPPYPVEWLRERAEKYAADPEMAGLLGLLANYPALNAKLNRQSVAVRNQNIALHYQIVCALEPKTKKVVILQQIADLWVMAPATVKEIAIEHGPTARMWLGNLILHIDVRSEFATRDDILRALNADMVLRVPTF
jgi:hypothetical protein